MASQKPQPNRAGRYVTQVTGYRAFIPAPLPPVPPLQLAPEILSQLSEAGRALGRLDGSALTLPNPDLFVFRYVWQEAVLSSQIEGTQSSLQDVLAAEAQLLDEGVPADVTEVINYTRAMNHGLARLADLTVSVRLIREIQGLSSFGKSTVPRSRPSWAGPRPTGTRCSSPCSIDRSSP